MQRDYSLPQFERMSVVMAVVLLAYASARFIETPSQTLTLDFAGVFLALSINLRTIMSAMAALLAAAGADWILQDGQNSVAKRAQHWMVPALTAWIISLPLGNLPLSPEWWLLFAGGAALLSLVLLAEYISRSPRHRFFGLASVGLVALSYALFLILSISLQALEVRLVLILPALFLAAGLIGARVQLLGETRDWSLVNVVALAFLTTQAGAALHYWPLSALAYGLLLLGLLYTLTAFFNAIQADRPLRQALVENGILLGLFAILAVALP